MEMFPPGILPPEAISEAEIRELTRAPGHWRSDLKWILGLIAALFLFTTITLAGFYRVTGPGRARDLLVPLVENATGVKSAVKGSYRNLRSRAKGKDNSRFVIPGVGVNITLSGEMINSLGPEDLANRVSSEVASKLYNGGYRSGIPMKEAFGVGEQRAQAVTSTLLSILNKKTHNAILWPMIVSAGLALALFILFFVFCHAWGKAIGSGFMIIAASLPASLFIRLSSEFLWEDRAGVYRNAMGAALRQAGNLMVLYYDIALGAGALLLLVGVIGAVVTKHTRERVPPFLDLERSKSLAGGPPVDFLGLEEQQPPANQPAPWQEAPGPPRMIPPLPQQTIKPD